MKIILAWLLLICCSSCIDNSKEKTFEEKKSQPITLYKSHPSDSLFEFHFKILDSVAKTPPRDTMYNCCYNSINFMEVNTGIDAEVEGDYAGPTGFRKQDLQKWHQWYDSAKSVEWRKE